MITVDFSRLDVKPGIKILDIGCGPGRHTCEAYRIKDAVVIGADLSHSDLCDARNRLKYHDQLGEHGGGSWGISVANVTSLPFPDEAFDLVICSEVLEHIPDDHIAIQEIVRVLKTGGDLVVSVPRYLPERICWALSDEYYNANQGHVRIYKKNELLNKVENAGVKNWGFHFAHALHTPYWWLKCLVGPTREDSKAVNLYHQFLAWDIMKKTKPIQLLDKVLNPLIGKSIVLYFKK